MVVELATSRPSRETMAAPHLYPPRPTARRGVARALTDALQDGVALHPGELGAKALAVSLSFAAISSAVRPPCRSGVTMRRLVSTSRVPACEKRDGRFFECEREGALLTLAGWRRDC